MGLANNRFAAHVYKPTKVDSVTVGLGTTTASLLSEILADHVSLKLSVTGLMAQAKAPETMENY